MAGMKRDMSGSEAQLGAFLALAKTGGLPDGKPLHCVLCLAENSVSEISVRPDDIITMVSICIIYISVYECVYVCTQRERWMGVHIYIYI